MLSRISEMNLNMLMYIGIMALLISIAISIRIKNGIIFKALLKFAVAICIISGVNFLSSHLGIDVSIPFNPVTASIIAFLQIPGLILVYIAKMIIYPM